MLQAGNLSARDGAGLIDHRELDELRRADAKRPKRLVEKFRDGPGNVADCHKDAIAVPQAIVQICPPNFSHRRLRHASFEACVVLPW
ncbi:hypothetical protein HAP47_0006010 [Bradyrhizobium sp. 41S5]|uniref:hypothetical protein n=1 Tax=Bradyrhizobium sp. 41S5 TaxID=1404443 RepID=UPI001E4EB57D|nr:hypothetical protein [Bradyrhizobium sp. 41S5]UFX49318.1 hypothetical protein HAP47_0006010 [Bradyrhizobium sp. 41S5]